jgi:hypothetical protein
MVFVLISTQLKSSYQICKWIKKYIYILLDGVYLFLWKKKFFEILFWAIIGPKEKGTSKKSYSRIGAERDNQEINKSRKTLFLVPSPKFIEDFV